MTLDSLFGDEPKSISRPALKRRGRPPGSKTKPRQTPQAIKEIADETMNFAGATDGVTIASLVVLFNMPRARVAARLVKCPILSSRGATRFYDLATAAKYLVDPIIDIEAFISELDPSKLPDRTRETYWNAQIKELKYQALAGELWPTDSVVKVLGDTFKSIRGHTMLWADTVEEKAGLSAKQHSTLVGLVDQLLNDLHAALVGLEKKSITKSKIADLYDTDSDII